MEAVSIYINSLCRWSIAIVILVNEWLTEDCSSSDKHSNLKVIDHGLAPSEIKALLMMENCMNDVACGLF